MRIVFVGSSGFGLSALREIFVLPCVTVVGVLTNSESFDISYSSKPVRNVLHANFQDWALAHQVSCYFMIQDMKAPALAAWLTDLKPDLMVVVGWYHMIPASLRRIAPAVGLHASLLPDYSGGAPLVWAMIKGEKETGVTLFEMDDGVDNGGIYGQAGTQILEHDTIASLYARIETLGIGLLKSCLPGIAAGTLTKRRQDESARRVFPQRNPSHGLIDWHQPARDIYNFVRAQSTPYPGAFSIFAGKKVSIWAVATLAKGQPAAPGSLRDLQGRLAIACGNAGEAVEVLSLSDESGACTVAEWVARNRAAITKGGKFEV